MANNLVQESTAGVGQLLSVLTRIRGDLEEARSLVNLMGWELPPGIDDIGLASLDLGDFVTRLDAVIGASDEEWQDEIAMLGRIAELAVSINALVETIVGLADELPAELAAFPEYIDRTQIHKELPRRLFDFLIINYISQKSPFGFAVLHLINVIDYPHFEADPANFQIEHVRATLNYHLFETLVTDPGALAQEAYGWGTPEFDAMTLLQRVSQLFQTLGLRSRLQLLNPLAEEVWLDEAGPESDPSPQIVTFLHEDRSSIAGLRFGISIFGARPTAFGARDGGVGLAPIVRGQAQGSVPFYRFDDTFIDFFSDGDLLKRLALIVRPDSALAVKSGSGVSDILTGRLAFGLRRGGPESEPTTELSFGGGSVLQLRQVLVTAGLEKFSDQPSEGFVELALLGGSVRLSLDRADGFLQETIAQRQVGSPFDLRAGWSSERGIYFQGSSGLSVTVPVHARSGPFELNSLRVEFDVEDEGLKFEASVNGTLSLGPLLVTVQRLGLQVDVEFGRGNLGVFGLSPAFKSPSGLGLTVDGGGFKGGGFLDFEPEQQRYAGMLELEYQDQFTLKAFGLLTTRLPNGQSGFSLLIVISSEFTPIQLGFGFKLNGVGGLLGLNRSVRVEPLRSGLRDNTLSSVLFPTDIVANADRILSDLKQVFPPENGRFVFGPMARITWGTPVLLTVDLGLVIEIPDPVRLIILGVVRARLPDERTEVLRLQVNFLGEIDFKRERLSFDAVLFDSRLLAFPLSGDMALRLYWGGGANLLVSVGGFHPAYQPPAMSLPAPRRLTVALLDGDNPRLRLELYVAITSNTAQFGARLELYAAASKFNVYGFLSFDALFQFNPFYFVADVTAMLALRIGSSSVASIKLTLMLEGPAPWKAQGTASFKICWFFTLKVRFSKSFGETRNTRLPDLTVVPLLLQALSAADNWEGEFPVSRHRLESLSESQTRDQVLVHPVGTIKISQKVAPLNLRIDRIGSQRPSDAREFRIAEVEPGEAAVTVVQEAFAPAQYFDMTDEEKLASPSFRNYDSGIRIGGPERLHTGYGAAREVRHEIKYIDSARQQRLARRGLFEVDAGAFNNWSVNGSIARSELSFARRRTSPLAPQPVRTRQEPFAIVHTSDLTLVDGDSLMASEYEALARINVLTESNPALKGSLQVVPAFEAQQRAVG